MLDFRAAIFDLDGTILDSMRVWEKIDLEFLARRNLPVPDAYIDQVRTKNFKDAAEYTIATFSLEESPEEIIAEWNEMAIDIYAHRVPLKPHAREYLLYLKSLGVKLGTATVLPRALYEPALRSTELYDLFDAFSSIHEVNRGKGYPDIYLLAASKLGFPPRDCVAFEDILLGVKGIVAAGIRAYGVFDECSAHEEAQIREIAQGYIRDFAEMMPGTVGAKTKVSL